MDKQQLKARVAEALRARRADIEAVAKSIFAEPELGYKEVKTSAKVKALFDDLGLEYTEGWGLTGVKARMKGKGSKRTVAMVGELDAIVCRGHEAADPVTGAAHCCGHNIQIANMAAVAMALKDAGAMEYLGGDVVVFAVPAEEYVEIDYRSGLRADGKSRYLGGKQQIIAEGGFDDVDMAMQMHVDGKREEGNFACGGSCNGFIGKLIEYRGRTGPRHQRLERLHAGRHGRQRPARTLPRRGRRALPSDHQFGRRPRERRAGPRDDGKLRARLERERPQE